MSTAYLQRGERHWYEVKPNKLIQNTFKNAEEWKEFKLS